MSNALTHFTPTGTLSKSGKAQFRCSLDPCSRGTGRFGLLTKHPRTSPNFVKHLRDVHHFIKDTHGKLVPPTTANRTELDVFLALGNAADTTKGETKEDDEEGEEDERERQEQTRQEEESDEVTDSEEDSSQTRSIAHALRRKSVRDTSTPNPHSFLVSETPQSAEEAFEELFSVWPTQLHVGDESLILRHESPTEYTVVNKKSGDGRFTIKYEKGSVYLSNYLPGMGRARKWQANRSLPQR